MNKPLGREEWDGMRDALVDRHRDSTALSHARKQYGEQLMVRCRRCSAEYERYKNHHGFCQDCH